MPKILWTFGLVCTSVWAAPKWPNKPISLEAGASIWNGPNFEAEATLFHPLDQMVLVGVGTGYRQSQDTSVVPVLAGIYVRLPIGKILMPVVRAEIGQHLSTHSKPFWRLSLGSDLKLGRKTSLISKVGIESDQFHDPRLRLALHTGILYEP